MYNKTMRGLIKRALVYALVATMVFSQSGLFSTTAQAAKKKVVKATKVTLNYKGYTLKKGAKVKLKATVTPKRSTQKKTTWKSSNKKIATVSSKGVVSGKKYGKATITATVKGTKKKATCKIEVVKTVKVRGVNLSLPSVNLITGQAYTLKATINPSNASNKKITWSSSNPAVATVHNGTITALVTGTAVITATAKDGSKKTASSTVTVTNPVNGLTVTPATKDYLVGEEFQLTSTITPANADNLAVTWISSDPSTATVTNGLVKALKPGKVTITATSADGKVVGTSAVNVLTSLNVMDIQGISEVGNTISRMNTRHNIRSYIDVNGSNAILGSNFALKVADGVTYEVANISNSFKIITLHYKGKVKLYELNYNSTTNNSSYSNPLITGISDGNNLFTYYNIYHDSKDEMTGTINLAGMNPTLSSNLSFTVKPGVSYTLMDDPRGADYENKLLLLTKDNKTYSYVIYYSKDRSKIDILSATDGTNVLTYSASGIYTYDGEISIMGINPTLSSAFALEVVEGATCTITDSPDKDCDRMVTVSYGDLKVIYYVWYSYDTKKAQLLSVSDVGNTSVTDTINDDSSSIGSIIVKGDAPSLSSQFSAIVSDGCTYQIIDDATKRYDKIIRVTKGAIVRNYFVTYIQN